MDNVDIWMLSQRLRYTMAWWFRRIGWKTAAIAVHDRGFGASVAIAEDIGSMGSVFMVSSGEKETIKAWLSLARKLRRRIGESTRSQSSRWQKHSQDCVAFLASLPLPDDRPWSKQRDEYVAVIRGCECSAWKAGRHLARFTVRLRGSLILSGGSKTITHAKAACERATTMARRRERRGDLP